MAMGQERSMAIDRKTLCSNHGDYQAIVPRPTSPTGQILPHIAGRGSGSLSPSPAQSRAIAIFIEGKSTEQIALEMGVKHATAQSVRG